MATNQYIGGTIGIGLGAVCAMTTTSIVLFDMSWQSRLYLWILRSIWAVPLSVTTSYMIGAGVADRELLGFDSSTFAILCMPIGYAGMAHFCTYLVIAFHPSVFTRLNALIATAAINLIIASGASLDVWQRHSMLRAKKELRDKQDLMEVQRQNGF